MASSSHRRDRNSDGEDDIFTQIDNYEPNITENIEKSLTNINIHLSNLSGQHAIVVESRKHVGKEDFVKMYELFVNELKVIKEDVRLLMKTFCDYVEQRATEHEEENENLS